jgi:hypothetical protein
VTTAPASVLSRPEPSAAGPGDRLCHVTCCDPGLALCGLDVSALGDCDGKDCRVCPLCSLADDEGAPCPVPGCKGGTGA